MPKTPDKKTIQDLKKDSVSKDMTDSGEIDLSKDLEDIELSLDNDFTEVKNDEMDSFKADDDIDELDLDLNLEDEITLDDNIKIDDNLDLDSSHDLQMDENIGDNIFSDNDINLDIEEENISLDDAEEFGVDLKSDPQTIDNFTFDDEEISFKDNGEIDFDETLAIDESDLVFSKNQDIKLDDEMDFKSNDLNLSDEEENLQALVENIETELNEEQIGNLGDDQFENIGDIGEEKEKSLDEFELKDEDLNILDEEIPATTDFGEYDFKEETSEILDEFSEDLPKISEDELDLNLSSDEIVLEADSSELEKAVSEESFTDELPDLGGEELDINLDESEQDLEMIDELSGNSEMMEDISLSEDSLSSEETPDVDVTAEDLTLSLDEVSEDSPDMELPDFKSEDLDVGIEELKDTVSADDDLSDISPEELSIDLADNEIESINLAGAVSIEDHDNIDISSFDTDESMEHEIIDENAGDLNMLEDEISLDLNIDDTKKIDAIEKKIFPDDESLPELDEEITSIDLGGSDELENSISPLKDTENILSGDISGMDEISDSGNLTDIDLDNIPEQKSDETELAGESISLSLDELEDVSKNAKFNETEPEIDDEKIKDDTLLETLEIEPIETSSLDDETETIDLDSLDADFKEVDSIDLNLGEPDEYAGLKEEMLDKSIKETKPASGDIDSLKSNIKDVLSYLDQLLDALPEEKIKEFAESKAFEKYKKLFTELKIK